MHKLLLIGDDERLATLVSEFLSHYGFTIHVTRRRRLHAQAGRTTRTAGAPARDFAGAPGEVLSRDQPMMRLRGVEFDGLDRSIDAGVSRLRKRFDDLAQEPQKFKAVWGRGYLFNPNAWED